MYNNSITYTFVIIIKIYLLYLVDLEVIRKFQQQISNVAVATNLDLECPIYLFDQLCYELFFENRRTLIAVPARKIKKNNFKIRDP